MKPNIFDIATKELSQDGFFTWLIKWADPDCKNYDEELNKCSQNFVKFLIDKDFSYNIDIKKVKAGRQWHNIDLWAQINDEILIIIEDKTSTFEHSNQLEKYKKFADDWCKKNNYKLVLIYLKTGTEFSGNSDKISQKGYINIDRNELINFFNNYSKIKNDIFQDYYERLISIDKADNSFLELPVKDWTNNSWIGFYKFLETKIAVTGWKYVPNQSGGFIGLWWHFLKWKDNKVYLQIEQGNFCFKIEATKNTSLTRNEWYNIIMKQTKIKGLNEIKKPKRFGRGIWMTVAYIDKKNWLGSDDSIINKEIVVNKLKNYEKFLDDCINN